MKTLTLNKFIFGIFFTLLGAITYLTSSNFIQLVPSNIDNVAIIFFICVIGLALFSPNLASRRFDLKPAQPWLCIISNHTALVGLGCFIFSLRFLSLLEVITLTSSFLIFFAALSMLFGKNFKIFTASSCLLALGCLIVLLCNKHFDLSYLLPIISGLFIAITFLLLEPYDLHKNISWYLYFLFIGALLSSIFLIFAWHSPNIQGWWLLLSIGILIGLSAYCLHFAYFYLGQSTVILFIFFLVLGSFIITSLTKSYWPNTLTTFCLIGITVGGIASFKTCRHNIMIAYSLKNEF